MTVFDTFEIPEEARTEEIANAVWDVFIEHGVYRKDSITEREYFVWAFQNDTMREWRLAGWMSYGCKFRGGTWTVDIYPEDQTEETAAVLDAVNAALAKLAKKFLPDS